MTCENDKTGTMYSLKRLLEKYFFIIPEYQRDYAQGRANKRDEKVLDEFVKEITKELASEEQTLHLDYVYGDIEQKNGVEFFYPVDGQQRLTTLFLFYIYCYQEIKEEKNFLYKLKYNIRPTSNKLIFCLIKDGFKEPSDSSSSDWNHWVNLFSEISKDPTAVALLRAYRKIESEMSTVKEKELRDKLEKISFEVVDTKEHKLQETVFWKMNARGRSLTQSEVFKAAFFSENKQHAENFNAFVNKEFLLLKSSADNDYQVADKAVMNIVNIIFEGYSLKFGNGFNFWGSTYISKDEYLNYKDNREEVNQIFSELKSKENPFALFDDSIPKYVKKERRGNGIQKSLENKNELTERVRALFFSYLIALSNISEAESIKDWMRICANIIWNASEVKAAISVIYDLHSNAKTILHYLASEESAKEDSKLLQYKEERIKASAIINNKISKDDIVKAENTAFADGRIDFLYYNAAEEVDWNNFIKRRDNFDAWFDDTGIKKEYKEEIVTAYIKLSPWDWNELYFNASKDHWKKVIFGGINDSSFGEGYRKIVDRLLSSSDLCSIDLEKGENIRSDVIRKSLVDSPWFIKWVITSNKSDYGIQWRGDDLGHFFQAKGKRTYIYWDTVCREQNSYEKVKEVNRFFWILRKNGVMILDGHWRLINDDGVDFTDEANKETDKYASSKYDEHYHLLAIINTWGYYGPLPFKYNNNEFLLLPQGIILLSREEEPNWDNEERWIYEKRYYKLLPENALLEKLNKLVEMKK